MTATARVAEKLVLLMGAGTVKGAWGPVLKALKTAYPSVDDASVANTAMANLIFNLRWWHFDSARRQDDASTAAALQHWQSERDRLCERIGDELKKAEQANEITLQDGFEFIWNRYVGSGSDFYLVTTNWDFVVDKRLEMQFPTLKDRVFHVHGDYRDCATLLLPSEVSFEPYYSDAMRKLALERHRKILDAVDRADAVVTYGLSLSPLDAELSQLISVAIDESSTKKVVEIVDLDPQQVARQLRCLLQKATPEIRCWRPPTMPP